MTGEVPARETSMSKAEAVFAELDAGTGIALEGQGLVPFSL